LALNHVFNNNYKDSMSLNQTDIDPVQINTGVQIGTCVIVFIIVFIVGGFIVKNATRYIPIYIKH
jgi:hypothetical protein